MANKTLYVKEEDLPLWESFADGKDSVSSLFSEFLRSKIDKSERISSENHLTLDEMNKMDLNKIPYIAVKLALVKAVDHLAAAISSGQSHLKVTYHTKSSFSHIAVTPKQFDETWAALPPELRFCDEDSARTKAGFNCYPVGTLLVWMDRLMPEDQWSEEVERELGRVLILDGQRHTGVE